jgi:acyl-CoA synthetase (AMP-forming)/AMP-acid ligase II
MLRVDAEMLRTERRVEVRSDERPHQTFLSTGRPVAGLQVRIVDERGTALPEDRVGIISISGSCLFEGYFKLEEESRRTLRDGWYETADLGFLHDGELYITGRANDLIIVHGKNYHAHELEYVVSQLPGVRPGRVAAVGLFRPEIGSEEIVVIAEREDGSRDPGSLGQQIKQALLNEAGLLVHDAHVVSPGWLIKTTSGKMCRGENLEKYLREVSRASAA